MEKSSKKTSAKKVNHEAKIVEAYKDYLLTHGAKPNSVYQFTSELKLKEEEFYKYFSSFDAIDSHLWQHFAKETIEAIKSEKVYDEYGAREKMLAFYYTLIERLKKDRSYVTMTFKRSNKAELLPTQLKGFRSDFDEFSQEIINEGVASEEIIQRPMLTERYHDGLWLQLMFVISFWLKDCE
jgi:AcrR family transcriptional regulator